MIKIKRFIKNKKAFEMLGEHTVEALIAALGLVALFGLAFLIYGLISGGDPALAKARGEVASLSRDIDALLKGPGGSIEHIVLGPNGWAIVGWPVDGLIPTYCSNQGWDNCLCWCNLHITGIWDTFKAFWSASKASVKENCDAEPVCMRVNTKTLSINPNLGSDQVPIYMMASAWQIISQSEKNFVGALQIVYDKSLDKLTITLK